MKRRLLVLFGALGLWACHPGAIEEREAPIIGGVPGGAAAVGLIVDLDGALPVFRCTATLIAEDAVLTAAHCILDNLPQHIGFVASHTFSAVEADEIIVARGLHPHPLFVGVESAPAGVAQANDLGLILLEEVAQIAPLPLAGSDIDLVKGDILSLVGAGWTFAGGSADGEMHQGNATLTELGDFEFACGLVGEAQACLGDSGGAVIAQGRLAGVISRAGDPLTPCENGSVSTRVNSYLDFISLHTTLPCGSGDQPPCGSTDATSAISDASASGDAGGVINPGGSGGGIVPREDDGCRVSGAPHSAPPLYWLLLLVLAYRARTRT